MKETESLRPLPSEAHFLTRFRSEPLPEKLEAYHYRAVARRLTAPREASVLAKLALALSRANGGLPVVRLSGRTLVSFEPLETLEVSGEVTRVEPLEREALLYRTNAGRRALLRVVRAYLKLKAASRGFIVGVSDFVLSPRFRVKDERGVLGLQTGVVFDLALGEENRLVLDCDMKSKILVLAPVSQRLAEDEEWDPRELSVSSLVDSETFTVHEVLSQTVGDEDEHLRMSILEYNTQRGRYPEGEEPDPTCPVVACRVGEAGRIYHYDSQLLHETLSLRGARRFDRDFAATLASATRLDTGERERFCSYFVRTVGRPGPPWLRFAPSAERVGKGNPYRAFDVALPHENLLFGGEMRAKSVEKGIVSHGLLSGPGDVALGALVPVGRERGAQRMLDDIVDRLSELCGGVGSFAVAFQGEYPPRNPFKIRAAVEELASSKAELALVLLPGRAHGSPYAPLKAELARCRFPSQMVHLDTKLSRRELVNILVGLTSKLGRSENWRIGRLLWPPDLFVGISAARVDEERVAAVATAFDRTGRALDVTVEVFGHEAEAIGESRLLHLLEGALLAYRNVHAALPSGVVIHRDGEFLESGYKRVWKHFRELDVDMTLVALDIGLPPRVGSLRRDHKEPPAPGTLVLTSDDAGFIVTTGPGKEGRGCPRPVGFRRVSGLIDARAIGNHIFWLSRAHVGSVVPPRLPVTIHFARRVVGMVTEGLVPQGTMGSRMLFV